MKANKSTGMTVFGIIVTVFSEIANLCHLPWFIWVAVEKYSGSMNISLAVLYPWIIEFLSLPALVAGIVFTILSFRKRPVLGLFISGATLTLILFLQTVLLNIFLFF